MIFAAHHLSDFGLPRIADDIFLPIAGLTFCVSLARLWRISRDDARELLLTGSSR